MTLTDIRDDLLRKLGIEDPGDASALVETDVLHAINAAGQLLNAAGDPYWRLKNEGLNFSKTTASADIDGHSIKHVRVKDGGKPLLEADSLWQLEQYQNIYMPGTLNPEPEAGYEAECYYIEAQSGPVGATQVTVHVGPKPLATVELELRYVPRFEAWTLTQMQDNSTRPDVAFEYIELTFLPLARYYASRSHWFSREDLLPKMEADFAAAVQALQNFNPELRIPYMDQLKQTEERPVAG